MINDSCNFWQVDPVCCPIVHQRMGTGAGDRHREWDELSAVTEPEPEGGTLKSGVRSVIRSTLLHIGHSCKMHAMQNAWINCRPESDFQKEFRNDSGPLLISPIQQTIKLWRKKHEIVGYHFHHNISKFLTLLNRFIEMQKIVNGLI